MDKFWYEIETAEARSFREYVLFRLKEEDVLAEFGATYSRNNITSAKLTHEQATIAALKMSSTIKLSDDQSDNTVAEFIHYNTTTKEPG